jgi:hypothetical protein
MLALEGGSVVCNGKVLTGLRLGVLPPVEGRDVLSFTPYGG